MQKQLKDFTDVELKSIAYDNLAQTEQCQLNIKAINQELASRSQTKQEPIIPESVDGTPELEKLEATSTE